MFVGRDAERRRCDELLEALDATGQLLVVEGEPGIGKTTLLGLLGERAAARGISCVSARAERFTETRPFAVASILAATPLTPVPGERPAGRRAASVLAALDDDPGRVHQVVDAALDAIERRCLDGPLLLVVDDVQWVDPASTMVLEAIVPLTEELPLGLVVACRTGELRPDIRRLVHRMTSLGSTLSLSPLGADEVSRLVESVIDRAATPTLLESLAVAGGNPFLITELLNSTSHGTAGAAERFSLDAGRAALQRFDLVDSSTVELLQLASVLGRSFRVTDLAAVSRRPVVELLGPLEHARRAGIVANDESSGEARLSFRHELLREALYSELPHAVRVALHHEIGDVLVQEGTPVHDVVPHLTEGALQGDRASAVLLWKAAEDIATEAPGIAADLLQRALDTLPAGDRQRDELRISLARARTWAGDVDDAIAIAEDISEHSTDDEQQAKAFAELARARFFQGRIVGLVSDIRERVPGGEPLLEAAVAADDRDGGASARAEMALLSLFRLDLTTAEQLASEALGRSEDEDDADAAVIASMVLAWTRGVQGHVQRALDDAARAVRLADASPGAGLHRYGPCLFNAIILDATGHSAEALDAIRAAVLHGQRAGTLGLAAGQHSISACVLYRMGAWDDARADALAQVSLAEERGLRVSLPWAHAVLARIATYRDEMDEARRWIEQGEAELAHGTSPLGADWLLWSKAIVLEAEGDDEGALALLGNLLDLMVSMEAYLNAVSMGIDVARLARRLDDRERLGRLEQACQTASTRAGDVPVVHARVPLCRGDFQEAADLLRPSPRPFEFAQVAELAALDLGARNKIDDARPLLEEALAAYAELGATRSITTAETAARAVGVTVSGAGRRHRPTSGWVALTETERTIAELVGEGLTNADVANRLGSSKRTVEAHLRQVFRKLGITSRVALVKQVSEQA